MAYAIKYLFKFESSNGTTREIRVLQDGYTGEVIQRPLGRAPILKKQKNGTVFGTSLEFYAECHVDREFIEFYTSDPKAYRVDLYAGATLLWQGYITPELYSEPDIAPPYDVRVVATDGVGELKLYDYAAQGTVTLRALLSGLLARTGLGTDVYLISSLKAGSRGAGALLDMTINLDYMAGKTCYETLTYILDTLHATITWWKGAWILTRETNVTFTSGKVRYFNTAGNSALLADSVQTLGSLRANPAWPVGQLSTVIDPAKNRVAVQAPWHVVTCLQNSDMGSDSDWTKAKNARYETDGYVLPVNVGTGTDETAVISQATSMAGLRVPMSISVKATGAMSEITARVIGSMLGVLLTYKVGNVTYHLVKGEDGSPTWQQGEEIGTYIPLRGARIDFQQQLVTWNVSRIEAEELSIDNIPPFLQGASFPAGTLTVYILGYCVKVYGATLDVILPKGYQDILRIDNGARGEGSEVEVAIGRETADNAYYAAFLQGLLLDSGNLITSFSDANFPAGMDYLAFIARDYALSVALPRAKVTGTVYLESGIAAPPLVFTKGALNYWLQTWSWNLKEDELEIDALTLPSASLTVESETILESNGSTVSSADSAGSSGPSSFMGVGTNYFELATDPTLVQLRQAYSYLGPRKGLIFEANEEADTNADFEKVALPGGGYALHSKLPFYSDSFISAGGIAPGGGASAGNATLVAQTYGGTLSATGIEGINFYSKERVDQLLLTAGTVQTVAGVSPTNGDIPVASLKSALGLGAAAACGIGSVASGNTGLVTGGSVYSAINEAVSSVMKMQGTTTTPISDGSTTNPVVIDGSSYTAKKGDVVLYDGKEYLWAGSAWEQLGDEASWALKTTSIFAGTGLEGGGTLASNRTISLSAASIASLALADSAYQKPSTGIPQTDLASALSTKIDHGENAYNSLGDYLPLAGGTLTGGLTIIYSGDFKLALKSGDADNFSFISFRKSDDTELGYLGVKNSANLYWGDSIVFHSGNSNLSTVDWAANQMIANSFKLASGTPTLTWDSNANAWHLSGNFYADGFISAGGLSPGGGTGGIDLAAMWASLQNNDNVTTYDSYKIHTNHLPTIAGTGITGTYSTSGTAPNLSTSLTLDISSALADYLPLAGGTMTGSIVGSSGMMLLQYNTNPNYLTGTYYTSADTEALVFSTVKDVTSFIFKSGQDPSAVASWKTFTPSVQIVGQSLYINERVEPEEGVALPYNLKVNGSAHIGNIYTTRVGTLTTSSDSLEIYGHNGVYIYTPNIPRTYVNWHDKGILIDGYANNGAHAAITTRNNAELAIAVDGTLTQMYFKSNSRIGVNTASPECAFDVVGDFQVNRNNKWTINTKFSVSCHDNFVGIYGYDMDDQACRFHFYLEGNAVAYMYPNGNFAANGTITGTGFIVANNSGFLKADGTIDSTSYYYSGNLSLATLAGSSAVGSSTQPVYYTGSALAACDLSTTYAPYNSDGYLPLTGGTLTGALKVDTIQNQAGTKNLVRANSGNPIIGNGDGTLYLATSGDIYNYVNNAHYYKVFHEGNSNRSDATWEASALTADSLTAHTNTRLTISGKGVSIGGSGDISISPSSASVYINWGYRGLFINGYAASGAQAAITTRDNCPVSIAANGSENQLYLDASSHVGINMKSLTYALEVAGDFQVNRTDHTSNNTTFRVNCSDNNVNIYAVDHDDNAVNLNFYLSGNKRVWIDNSGNLASVGAITAGSASSREFKDNVQNMSLEYARNIIMSSRPITFQWNALAHSLCDKYEGDGIGFIAQEAEQLMPFAVSPIFEKYKRLDYTAYVSPLVRMSQYLLTTTDNHEARIRQLERENAELKRRLNMN